MAEEEAPAPATVSASDMESRVKTAMVSRVSYFKEQADSLTFEGVRRLLEKDLGLDTYALDVHKRFVKQCLQECLESGNEDEGPKNSGDAAATISSVEGQSIDKNEEKEAKEPDSKDGLEESPEVGLMEGHGKSKTETESTEDIGNRNAPSEAMIKKAILKRASHFRKNSENITMVGVRRLLEGDLKLDKFALDPYKKLVSEQVNELLSNPQVVKSAKNDKKTDAKKKIPKKSSQAELSASSESELEEDEVKPRRKSTPKGKTQSLSGLKKRKQHDEDLKEPKRKQAKTSVIKSKESSGGEDGSEQENSESSAEKPVKKKEVPKPSYGKRVENLKSVIKSCAMSIPPSVYKKAKQAPENKREDALIKELEDILAKEGLSANPSEKEIKEVKKKKERAKELEGIDMSNIVSSSRRRSTFSFAPPPKPKIPAESDADSGDSEDEDDDDGDDDDDDEEVNEEQDEEEEVEGNKSEEEEDDGGDSD